MVQTVSLLPLMRWWQISVTLAWVVLTVRRERGSRRLGARWCLCIFLSRIFIFSSPKKKMLSFLPRTTQRDTSCIQDDLLRPRRSPSILAQGHLAAVAPEKTLARICREVGATVRANVKLRDMNVVVRADDER